MELFAEYSDKSHFLSRIDARVKFLVGLTTLVMILSYKGFLLPVFVTLSSIVLCAMMRASIKRIALKFAEPLFLSLVLVVLKLFFSGHDPLFSINIMNVTISGHRDGLIEGMTIGARVLGAVSIVILLSFSTSFTEYVACLSWLKVPRTFIEILSFAYRYIFVLIEDALVIYSAQKNRLGYSSVRRGLESFGVLSGSILLKAFEQSHNITTAMIQRGYDGNIPAIKHKPFKLNEIFVSVLIVGIIGLIWKM